MSKPTINTINTYLQNPSTHQRADKKPYHPVTSTSSAPPSLADSRDELIACIREMEIDLGEYPGAIDEYWGIVDLRVWLRGLEQLRDKGKRLPVPLTPSDLTYYAMSELL